MGSSSSTAKATEPAAAAAASSPAVAAPTPGKVLQAIPSNEQPKLLAKEDKGKIFLLFPDVFDAKECGELKTAIDKRLRQSWATQGGKPALGRFVDSMDDPKILAQLFEKIKPLLPAQYPGQGRLIGFHPDMRVMKYQAGGRGEPHLDYSVVYVHKQAQGNDLPEQKINCESQLTAFIYLNHDFEGGTTRFFPSSTYNPGVYEKDVMPDSKDCVDIVPRAGAVSIFQQDLYHAGMELTKGEKYAIKLNVLYEKGGKIVNHCSDG